MNARRAALALAAVCGFLAACGQKGPLYLPDARTGTVVTRPAPPATESGPAPSTTPTPDSPPPAPSPAPAGDEEKPPKNGQTPRT